MTRRAGWRHAGSQRGRRERDAAKRPGPLFHRQGGELVLPGRDESEGMRSPRNDPRECLSVFQARNTENSSGSLAPAKMKHG